MLVLRIPRRLTFFCLLSAFELAFILSPYWALAAGWKRYVAPVVFLIAGTVWAYWSSGDLRIVVRRGVWRVLVPVALLLILVNFRALTFDLPLRGDEPYHVLVTLDLWHAVDAMWVWIGVALLALCIAGIASGKRIPYLCLLIPLFLPAVAIARPALLRYPLASRWLHTLPLYTADLVGGVYVEALFRLVPLAGAIVLAWLVAGRLASRGLAMGLGIGLLVATTPVVLYYSSLLYLEMPAVALMTLACLHAARLTTGDWKRIRTSPGWYGLVLIGFVKETVAPFLGAFVLARLLMRRGSDRTLRGRALWWLNEARVAFCALAPLLLYLALRAYKSDVRSHTANFRNLLDPALLAVVPRALVEQLGPLLLLAAAGCLLLLRRKRYALLLFLLLSAGADLVFHLTDKPWLVGYSRFTLFLVPQAVVGAYLLVRATARRSRLLAGALLVAGLAFNWAWAPIHLDGSRVPGWGSPLIDVNEHSYPYRAALSWLRTEYPTDRIRFTGSDANYPFDFYFEKYDWWPVHDTVSYGMRNVVGSAVAVCHAARHGITVVVHQDPPGREPERTACGYVLVNRFSNAAHSLSVYRKP